MENIKKLKVRGYILLESLFALACLITIVHIILYHMNRSQQELKKLNHIQETLITARMAIQSKKDRLLINNTQIKVVRNEGNISIYENETLLYNLKKH